jgi:hypothetical protein
MTELGLHSSLAPADPPQGRRQHRHQRLDQLALVAVEALRLVPADRHAAAPAVLERHGKRGPRRLAQRVGPNRQVWPAALELCDAGEVDRLPRRHRLQCGCSLVDQADPFRVHAALVADGEAPRRRVAGRLDDCDRARTEERAEVLGEHRPHLGARSGRSEPEADAQQLPDPALTRPRAALRALEAGDHHDDDRGRERGRDEPRDVLPRAGGERVVRRIEDVPEAGHREDGGDGRGRRAEQRADERDDCEVDGGLAERGVAGRRAHGRGHRGRDEESDDDRPDQSVLGLGRARLGQPVPPGGCLGPEYRSSGSTLPPHGGRARQPAPRNVPGRAPVGAPSSRVGTPFTIVAR